MLQIRSRMIGLKLMLLLLAAVVVISGCGKSKETAGSGQIVAEYQGGQISQAEFDKFMAINRFFDPQTAFFASDPSFQEYMLKQLIAFKVLAERADDETKKEADRKVKEEMNQFVRLVEAQGGKGALDKELKAANLTKRDIEQFFQRNYYVIDSMEKTIDDKQVKEDYDKKLKSDPHVFTTATVRHILIMTTDRTTGEEKRTKEEALKRANEVLDKLKNGGDFAELAKEYSDDPGSKDNGGQYADYPVSAWVPEFKKAAVELPLNQISDPIEVDYGYHILKVEARSTKTFDEVKDSLRTELAQSKVYDFITNEIPGMIESIDLPEPEKPADTANPEEKDSGKTNPEGTDVKETNPAAPDTGKSDSGEKTDGK